VTNSGDEAPVGPPVETFEEALTLVPTLSELERERPATDFDRLVGRNNQTTLFPRGLDESGIADCRPLTMHLTDGALHTHVGEQGSLVLGAELMLGAEVLGSLGEMGERTVHYDGVLVTAGVGCDRAIVRHLTCTDGRNLECTHCEALGTRLASQTPGVSYQDVATQTEDTYEDVASCACPVDELASRIGPLETFLAEQIFLKREESGPRFYRSRRACRRAGR